MTSISQLLGQNLEFASVKGGPINTRGTVWSAGPVNGSLWVAVDDDGRNMRAVNMPTKNRRATARSESWVSPSFGAVQIAAAARPVEDVPVFGPDDDVALEAFWVSLAH